MTTNKSRLRTLNRRGSNSGKLAPPERRTGRLPEPSGCDRCGAVFQGRVWRRPTRVSHAALGRMAWTTCPACRQVAGQEGYGRIVLRGGFLPAHTAEIRARLENVAAEAARRQPERRIVSIAAQDGTLEVLTTSQRLAHRLLHELKKAFRGRAAYVWSDDGTLFGTWERDAEAPKARP